MTRQELNASLRKISQRKLPQRTIKKPKVVAEPGPNASAAEKSAYKEFKRQEARYNGETRRIANAKLQKAYDSYSKQYDFLAQTHAMKPKYSLATYAAASEALRDSKIVTVDKEGEIHTKENTTGAFNAPRELAQSNRVATPKQVRTIRQEMKSLSEEKKQYQKEISDAIYGTTPAERKQMRALEKENPEEFEKHVKSVTTALIDEKKAKGELPASATADPRSGLLMTAEELHNKFKKDAEFAREFAKKFGKEVKSKKDPNKTYYTLEEWYDSPKAK